MNVQIRRCGLAAWTVLALGCSAGGSHESGAADAGEGSAVETPKGIAALRAGLGIAPRTIVPAVPPLVLDERPVKVMVELEGEPITRVQARRPDVRLSVNERELVRSGLLTQQTSVRRDLEATGATVLRAYQNAYNGVAIQAPRSELGRIAKLPGVVGVHPLIPKKKTSNDAPSAVVAPASTLRAPAGLHGEAVKVAVIDTGIDYTHANFGGPGTAAAYTAAHAKEASPADTRLFGPRAPRIKGGIDLAGDAYDASSDDPAIATPHADPNPLDCDGHGSHVAGILGGSGVTADGHTYAGSLDNPALTSALRIPPGVAPRVDLYAVRIFGCTGDTDLDLDGIEWAVEHDMDVINMSLGTDLAGGDDPSAVAAANAVESGVVVVAAAGNSGGAPYVAGAPANGEGVVSVAALDAESTLPAADLALGSTTIRVANLNAAVFADGARFRPVVLGSAAAPSDGCNADDYARPDVPGALLVMVRGNCFFDDRMALASAAGAAGIALIDNVEGYPPFIIGADPEFQLPFFGVLPEDAAALVDATSIAATNATLENPDFQRMADFSSSGPRGGDSALKPSVVAPGVNVVSTAVGTGALGVALSGTSMASPYVAGVAALTRQAHPRWRALDIANVLTNTADPALVGDYGARRAGTGEPQAPAAEQSSAVADSLGAPAVSFGFVELGRDASASAPLTVRNLSNAPLAFDISVPSALVQGFAHVLSVPAHVDVPPLGQARVNVGVKLSSATPADPLAFDDFSGMLVLTPAKSRLNAGVTLRVPYYGVVRPEAHLDANAKLPTARSPKGLLTVTNRRSKVAGSAEVYAWGIASEKDAGGCEDVRAAGVEALPYGDGDSLLVFAINGWVRCSAASINEYDVAVQTDDGKLFVVIGVDAGLVQTGTVSGELGTLVLDTQTGATTLMPAVAATDSSVVYLTALASELALSTSSSRFTYALQVTNLVDPTAVDAPAGTARFDAFRSPLDGTGAFQTLAPGATASVPLGVHRKDLTSVPVKGYMVVLPENAPGEAQAALFDLGN